MLFLSLFTFKEIYLVSLEECSNETLSVFWNNWKFFSILFATVYIFGFWKNMNPHFYLFTYLFLVDKSMT